MQGRSPGDRLARVRTHTLRPLIDAADLLAPGRLARCVLVDARGGPDARVRYQALHLAGARFVDLDRDLADSGGDAACGGRHPLPAPSTFAALVGELGIAERTPVVVYDDTGGAIAAARFWWMLSAFGHRDVRVLDGGLARAAASGLPTASGPDTPRADGRPYPADRWLRPTVTAAEVSDAAADPARLVIDVREASRFTGEHEPIDTIAGHIPGAVNVPYAGHLAPDGRFLATDRLAARYRAALGDRAPSNVIVHCGSGVTACHTILAMEQAGLYGAALYVGSWSEWSRSNRTVAVGSPES